MSEGFQSQVLNVLAELQKGQAGPQNGQAELRTSNIELWKGQEELQARFAGLQEGLSEQRAVLDRVEGKVDRVGAEITTMRTCVTSLEMDKASGKLRVAFLHARLDEHKVRLILAERRLELRQE